MSALTQTFRSLDKRVVQFAAAGAALLIAAVIALPRYNMSRSGSAEHVASLKRLYASTQLEKQALTDSSAASIPSAGPVATAIESAAPVAANTPSSSADRKLVRTGSLELTVKSPAAAAEQIRRMAESMGGYLESSQIGGTKDAPTADLTIRVPVARFEDAKAQIRTLAARVESEKTDATDVTRQYVDMQARLRNLHAEEAQYLAIMKSAFKVDDMLEVTQKLSEVRGEIEQQQAEFQTLSKQVETVALSIALRAIADTQVSGLNWRPLYELKLALRNGLDALADYAATMAAILFYVPVILVWSVTILFAAVLGWRLLRWTGRRFFAWPAPAAPQKAAESA
jgi:Domain of unknown function (DUF4349)